MEPVRKVAAVTEGRYPAIGDYALIGDCHSAALVARDGSIDWCCFHRFDARPDFRNLLVRVVDHVGERWQEPDEGIWEVRGGRRHFVHSKGMKRVAVDRALKLSERLRLPAETEAWKRPRDEIRRRVEANGVDPRTGAFVQSFGSTAVDASSLPLPLIRSLPPDDPRIRATFAICSFRLVDNLVLTGEVERGRQLFERLLAYCNDLGMLAEEIDA
jgi:alpha,alpha-trehalase